MHVPHASAIWSTILLNLPLVALEPGVLLLHPLAASGAILNAILVMLLSAAAYVGIVRQVHRDGWRPLHVIFLLYLLVIAAYPYAIERFLLPFAPLYFAGLWLEGRQIGGLIAQRLRQGSRRDGGPVAGILALAGLALVALIAVNYGYVQPRQIRNQRIEHQIVLEDEQGAFAWH